MRNRLDVLLRRCVELGSSDLHLAPNQPPRVRLNGQLESLLHPKLDDTTLRRLLRPLLAPEAWAEGKARGFWSFDYPLDPTTRFRVRAFRQQQGLAMVMHRVPRGVPRLAALGLPEAVRELASLRRGLVLLAGQIGSGRSCTQAALVADIASKRPCHLLLLEDDAGFEFPESTAFISHRRLGWAPEAWEEALRAASEADAEVIALARLPSDTCLRLALREAAAGRLVLACVHGPSALATLRALSGNAADLQRLLAQHVAAVLWQRLVPGKSTGALAAVELLERSAALSRWLQADDTRAAAEIPYRLDFDAGLQDLVEAGRITRSVALQHARTPELLPAVSASKLPAPSQPTKPPQASKPLQTSRPPQPTRPPIPVRSALPIKPPQPPMRKPAKAQDSGPQTIKFTRAQRTRPTTRSPTRRSKPAHKTQVARKTSASSKTTRIERRPRPQSARRLPTRKSPSAPKPRPPIRRAKSPRPPAPPGQS